MIDTLLANIDRFDVPARVTEHGLTGRYVRGGRCTARATSTTPADAAPCQIDARVCGPGCRRAAASHSRGRARLEAEGLFTIRR